MAWGRVRISHDITVNQDLLEHAVKMGAVITKRLAEDQAALADVTVASPVLAQAIQLQTELNEKVEQLVLDQARVMKVLMSEPNQNGSRKS